MTVKEPPRKNVCPLCGTKCVGCAGGRCQCGFNKQKVGYVVALFDSGYKLKDEHVSKFKVAVRKSKKYAELLEHVENGFSDIELVYSKKPNVKKKNMPKGTKCQFDGGSWNAWDVCIYCGGSRFYNEGKDCKVLIAQQEDEL